jgi:hypothetical protein
LIRQQEIRISKALAGFFLVEQGGRMYYEKGFNSNPSLYLALPPNSQTSTDIYIQQEPPKT